jgi:predicted kinase
MCGVAGSGKTTYAKQLEERGYVRLSIDEEMWKRFEPLGVDHDASMYDQRSTAIEADLRRRLTELVHSGRDVVVDFSFWERAARDRYKRLVVEAGGRWELIYLKVSRARLRERLAARSERFDANAPFPITDAVLERFIAGFQEPDNEGETIITLDD